MKCEYCWQVSEPTPRPYQDAVFVLLLYWDAWTNMRLRRLEE